MALFVIPTSSSFTWYVQPITLTGAGFNLEFRYNTRMQRWLLSIYSQSQQPVLLGIPLLINRDLTSQYRYLALPAGTFVANDTTGAQLEPVLSSFVNSHELLYVDAQA